MKWRPLTEPHSGIIRCIDTKRVLSEEEIAAVLEGKFHKRNDELEWLDERELTDDPMGKALYESMIGDSNKRLKNTVVEDRMRFNAAMLGLFGPIAKGYSQLEVEGLLKQQYENTKYDAIKALNTEYCRLYPMRDGLSSRLENAIINITQRSPLLK